MEQDWAIAFYPQGIPDQHIEDVQAVRKAFAECASQLQALLPPGRYKALVKTDLEKTAAMATKAFTHG